jgi:hypothetical protein
MRLQSRCPVCMHQERPPDEYVHAELDDNGWFHISCAQGHSANIILQVPKYELLFDLGVMAFLDGYTREAVTSFATSIERFYEFSIKALLVRNLPDWNAFSKTWSQVSNQSERQLGAYCFLYLRQFGRVPSILPQEQIAFRNKAVHKGYIPTAAESKSFGQSALQYLQQLRSELDKELTVEVNTVVFRVNEEMRAAAEKKGGKCMTAYHYVSTVLNYEQMDKGKIRSFEEALDFRKNNRWLMR